MIATTTTITMDTESSTIHLIEKVVSDVWNERLGQYSDEVPSETVLMQWQQETLAQVKAIYGRHALAVGIAPAVLEQAIRNCMNATIEAWKATILANPLNQPRTATTSSAAITAPITTSFSLFAALGAAVGGMGGFPAFFSWQAIMDEKPINDNNNNHDDGDDEDDAYIWQALNTKVEYMEDVYPDWQAEIRPWLQARSHTEAFRSLHRAWYHKARQQEAASPETAQILLNLMENVFSAMLDETPDITPPVPTLDSTTKRQSSILQLALDMWIDYLVRKETCPPISMLQTLWRVCFSFPSAVRRTMVQKDPRARWFRLYLQTHPSLYRDVTTTTTALDLGLLTTSLLKQQDSDDACPEQRLYALTILSHLLVIVRVPAFPWTQIHPLISQQQVYHWLWKAATTHNTQRGEKDSFHVVQIYTKHTPPIVEGLDALLSASGELRQVFVNDWAKMEHPSRTLLSRLKHFST